MGAILAILSCRNVVSDFLVRSEVRAWKCELGSAKVCCDRREDNNEMRMRGFAYVLNVLGAPRDAGSRGLEAVSWRYSGSCHFLVVRSEVRTSKCELGNANSGMRA
jgi:hypothetical protein